MFTTKQALPWPGASEPRFSGANDKPVAKSDHEMHYYYDDARKMEMPRSRWIPNTSGQ
jgi:hypothetical protein